GRSTRDAAIIIVSVIISIASNANDDDKRLP
ncbi:MAG: hypothetical protein ACI8RD_014371, partial [Bacillariaceae sp.]